MRIKAKTDYLTIIKYIGVFGAFLVFNFLEREVYPYSIAIFVTAMALGCNIFVTPLLLLLSFFVLGEFGLLFSATVPCILFMVVFSIYRHFKVKIRVEILLYTLLSMLGFVFMGDTLNNVEIEKRILVTIVVIGITFVSLVGINAVIKKGLKFKFSYDEKLALFVCISLFGLGVSNLTSPLVWKALALFLVLFSSFVFKFGGSLVFSTMLGIPLAIYYSNINFISLFLVLGLICECSIDYSRYLSAILLLASEYFVEVLFSLYGGYYLDDFIFSLVGCVLFLVIPAKLLVSVKDKLYSFREKQLTRQSINRNRVLTANKLYELGSVFTEIANSFSLFKMATLSEECTKEVIKKEIISNVCANCEHLPLCKAKKIPTPDDLMKMIDIGFAKGKLSLIDVPQGLNGCVHPTNLIYAINKLLADFRQRQLENMNIESGRELIALEAKGVAEILRELALETGSLLKYQSRLERSLADELFKNGFNVSEILIYGEGENLTIALILTMKEFAIGSLENIISKCIGLSLTMFEKTDINEDKCYLCFKKRAEFDAVFGIASTVKDGSEVCGDTHSVVRIKDDKFLVALSDGMGSGKGAENISSVSLSLIESFYKAGLKNELILSTVNKLLAINTTDSFTALDISVIDLKNCSADFIKYGSPYAFIIGDSGIKIIEGNSLPLGIIEEIKPAVCTTTLDDGDIVLFVSDGVSDAFSSSGDMIDFLRSMPSFNPQTLCDDLLSKAIALNNGIKKDDMTALAVRVFKTQQKVI